MTRKNVWLGIALSLAVPLVVLASNLVVPNMFSPGTGISSAQVNANFAAVQTAVNNRADVYGDGSAGNLIVTVNTDWNLTPPQQLNFQFANVSIAPGVTLTVPSGLVLRATGTFSNQGTLAVGTYVQGGAADLDSTASTEAKYILPGPGLSRSSASFGGRVGVTNQAVSGGTGGLGVGSPVAAAGILRPGPAGGGGGAAAISGSGTSTGFGSNGGGTLVILAGGTLVNGGTIDADGALIAFACSGGGGGGVVVLASKTTISNTGAISARGGAGNGNGTACAAGGGGGGGIVQLLGPTVTNTGTTDVTGGAAGGVGALFNPTGNRQGGAGGGGSGGNGGAGGGINAAGALTAAIAGGPGYALVRTLDPTPLF